MNSFKVQALIPLSPMELCAGTLGLEKWRVFFIDNATSTKEDRATYKEQNKEKREREYKIIAPQSPPGYITTPTQGVDLSTPYLARASTMELVDLLT